MCQFFAHKARTLAQTCARICAQFPKPGQSIYLPAAASSKTSISRLRLTARNFSLFRRLRATLSPAAARRTSTEQMGRGEAGRCMPVGGQRIVALTKDRGSSPLENGFVLFEMRLFLFQFLSQHY